MKSLIALTVLAITSLTARAQLTREEFSLNKEGKYQYSKTIAIHSSTDTETISKIKKFLQEYTEHLEGTTWEQVKGKNLIEASIEVKSPRQLLMDVSFSIKKSSYIIDIKNIEFYYHDWKPAEIVLGNTKKDFDEIRSDLVEGVGNLITAIETGIK
jgi:hypothetical protein